MKKRKIIRIIEEKCDGCGKCSLGCPEGAIRIIDGKARLVSEIHCDGLGACIGECPLGAIVTEEREALPYDEVKTMENISKQGVNTIKAHLAHLKTHGRKEYLEQALRYLKDKKIKIDTEGSEAAVPRGCPGSAAMAFGRGAEKPENGGVKAPSRLGHWPVQLHLISPSAPYFQDADILVAADCCAFSCGNFHEDFIKGKSLVIACPKLDSDTEAYVEKLRALVDEARVRSIHVVTMEVPCCTGLVALVNEALSGTERKPPVRHTVIGIKGDIRTAG